MSIYNIISYVNKFIFVLYSDVADGVNTPSPVKSIDINRIPPTPTKTVASPLFQAVTNGNNIVQCICVTSHINDKISIS